MLYSRVKVIETVRTASTMLKFKLSRLKVLETIIGVALGTGDLIVAILDSPYGSSLGKLQYKIKQREVERSRNAHAWNEKQRVRVCLSRLKKQGFIEQHGKIWKITKTGKQKLRELKKKTFLSYPIAHYATEKSNELIIISYDIPETEKRKRVWLRKQLTEMGFTLLQKSVWVGKIKLPRKFMDDLNYLNLMSTIHIFAVTKTGTVQNL